MSSPKSRLIRSAIGAARGAAFIFPIAFFFGILRSALDSFFKGTPRPNWLLAFKVSAAFSALWFVAMSLYFFVTISLYSPVEEIFSEESAEPDVAQTPAKGFVAMEYYWLILNRTFVVFATIEGLYVWKAVGIVTSRDRLYFEPLAEMLKDPDLMRDRNAIGKLSRLRGGCFIPRSEIVKVDIIDKQKWGMGGIPHSGRIVVHLTSGKYREFILLGSVYSDDIAAMVLNG